MTPWRFKTLPGVPLDNVAPEVAITIGAPAAEDHAALFTDENEAFAMELAWIDLDFEARMEFRRKALAEREGRCAPG